MKNITLHDFNLETIQKLYKVDIEYFTEDLIEAKSNYEFLDLIFNNAMNFVAIGNIVNIDETDRNVEFLKIANNGLVAWVILNSGLKTEVEVDLDLTGSVKLNSDKKEKHFHSGDWFLAWSLSTILRNNNALQELFTIEISLSSPLNDKDHVMIAFLKFLYFHSLGENESPELSLFEQIKEMAERNLKGYYMPDVEEFPYPNFFINFNQALVLKSLIEKDIEAFNKHLAEGLEYHKQFWGQKKGLNKGDAPLCDDPRGFISWPLTALAAMAYDKGMPIDVQSDYMPQFMVEGKFD